MEYFIDAAEITIKKHSNVRFFIVGDGELKDELINRVKEKHLENLIQFLGYRSDIQNTMKQFDFVVLKKYTKLAGIERNITPHMFRHSFATYLIEEGVDISCVQQILGHSSIKTTQIYIHVAAKKQAEILRESHPRNRMNILKFVA